MSVKKALVGVVAYRSGRHNTGMVSNVGRIVRLVGKCHGFRIFADFATFKGRLQYQPGRGTMPHRGVLPLHFEGEDMALREKAEDLASGRWPDLLIGRGMDPSFFSGKPGPCPLCGGKDRYRFVGKKYGGVYVCNGCTEDKYASPMKLLMGHMGYRSWVEAADDVRDYFGANGIEPVHRPAVVHQVEDEWTPERIERNSARMLKVWNEGQEITVGDPVHRWMQFRSPGIDLQFHGLRYHPALEYWAPPVEKGGRPVSLGKYPAMLAYAQGVNGDLVQLHKTYLTPDGRKANVPMVRKTDLGVGVNSFAVRMMEPTGEVLGVCEGIESGWGSTRYMDIPVWPCLNGPALAKFELPTELRGRIKKLVIFTDSDALRQVGKRDDGSARMRRPGSHYAAQAAETARNMRLKVLIVRSGVVGHDFEDYFNETQAAELT